jgi:hypothetical protein
LYDGIKDKQEAFEIETYFMIQFDSVDNGCNMIYSTFDKKAVV